MNQSLTSTEAIPSILANINETVASHINGEFYCLIDNLCEDYSQLDELIESAQARAPGVFLDGFDGESVQAVDFGKIAQFLEKERNATIVDANLPLYENLFAACMTLKGAYYLLATTYRAAYRCNCIYDEVAFGEAIDSYMQFHAVKMTEAQFSTHLIEHQADFIKRIAAKLMRDYRETTLLSAA